MSKTDFIFSIPYNQNDVKVFYSSSFGKTIDNVEYIFNDKYNTQIKYKIHQSPWSMKWHVDDCQIIKKKPNVLFQSLDNVKVFHENEKFAIVYQNQRPDFTLIYYHDVYQTKGGEIVFPHTTIKPENNLAILFPSHIPHKVNQLTKGIRKNWLVKFYPLE
jgi:hypothetical protein